MKIVLLQNTIINGKRMVAGEVADVSEAFAVCMAERNLAYIQEKTEATPFEEPKVVKKTTRRRTTKAVAK